MMGGEELPEKMIRLILVNLPDVKPLIRLKLVCKHWKVVISSSRFAAEHYVKNYSYGGRGNSLMYFLIFRWPRSVASLNLFSLISMHHADPTQISVKKDIYMPYVNLKNEGRYSQLPSIFDAGYGVYCLFDFSTNRNALWNPTMRELKVLPPAPSPYYCTVKPTYPDCRRQIFGFGHVEYENDVGRINYKVGRLIMRNDIAKESVIYFSIELYSSTTNGWKVYSDCYQVERYGDESISSFLVNGTNLNGRFHWFSWFSTKEPHILWFDYSSKKVGRMNVPALNVYERQYYWSASVLTRFDDRFLCLVLCWKSQSGNKYLDIWVMQEYQEINSWTKKHTVGPIPGDMCILGFWNKIKGIFLHNFEEGNRLFLCDCQSSNVENLGIGSADNLGFDSELWESMTVLEYTQSLISLDGESDKTQIQN